MRTLRTAVVGVGYLGRFHAQKHKAVDGVELIGVCDRDPARSAAVAAEVGTTAFTQHADLLGKIDAVTIAASTAEHFELARFFLEHGVHVLVEKPLAMNPAEVDEMIATSKATGRFLMEAMWMRFNPLHVELKRRIDAGEFGKITTIEPQISADTRNIRVQATLDNPDHVLKPGMFATVTFTASLGEVLTVPASAVLHTGQRDVVFADLGADVIKVEPPEGERTRHNVGFGSGLFPLYNRNKRSLCLDLKSDAGRAILTKLVTTSDALVENFAHGTMERLGFGWSELSKINPRLIMIRVSGFGQTGPRARDPGFGAIGEAMGGLRYVVGDPSTPPSRMGISIGDELAATFACLGALSALHYREKMRIKGPSVRTDLGKQAATGGA